MEIGNELVIPEPRKPELQSDRLLNALKSAINVVEDEKVRQIVNELFFRGGFLFEKRNSPTPVEGLAVASDKDSIYIVRFSGEKDPTVTLTVSDLQEKEVASLFLSQPPNIRPDLWNRWQNPSREMSSEDKQKVMREFICAKLNQEQTRKEAVIAMWKTLSGNDDPLLHWPGKLGNLRTMGKGWGDFVDAKHNVLHPLPPPKDVVYDYALPDEQANLLDEPGGGDWKTQVQKSFFQQRRELLRNTAKLEGVTGHQVISFKELNFEAFPTKRGLEIFNKLKMMIPIMLSGLTEKETVTIFKGFKDDLSDWGFVMRQLREGVEDGFSKNIEYVAKEIKEERGDEYYQETAHKENESRKFRFLAQVLAQKVKAGIKWRFIREKSEALQELVKMEEMSVDGITKKYGF